MVLCRCGGALQESRYICSPLDRSPLKDVCPLQAWRGGISHRLDASLCNVVSPFHRCEGASNGSPSDASEGINVKSVIIS